MGVFNSFSRFRLGDDDEDYEDDDLNDYDDEEEEAPRRSIFNRKNNYDEDDEDEYEAPRRSGSSRNSSGGGNTGRNTNAPAPSRSRGGTPAPTSPKMQVRIIKPSSFDQARQITDTLLAHRTVLLNLEGLDVNTAQRIVDFASGSCYALHGNFMNISHFIIVITPEDVDIAGDVTGGAQEAAAGAFAGAAAQSRTGSGAAGMNSGMPQDAGNPFMNGMSGMNGAY